MKKKFYYTILQPNVVVVEDDSLEYRTLLKAGWFTWDWTDERERIMTRPNGVPCLTNVFKHCKGGK